MILTQELKKEQLRERLLLKSAEESFGRQIVGGTNCSPFESQIIVDRAKQVFGIGEYAEGKILHDGQMVFFAVSADAPSGVSIEGCQKVRVVLTHIARAEDLEVLKKHGAGAKRKQQILRMAGEAREQGALLTQEDLGLLLDCESRTIRSDVQKLRQEGIIVPTRGTVRDIGPGVSHKRKAIELWLSGKEALDVARQLNHSLRAIERYIQSFCRVVYTQRKMRNMLTTALVVGISVSLANTYFDLHSELVEGNSFYKQRLEEVLSIGEAHWEAEDEKKRLSLMPSQIGRPSL